MECQYFLSSRMVWEAEFTDEFEEWWNTISEAEQDDTDTAVRVLQQEGPLLREPLSKRIEASRHEGAQDIDATGRPAAHLHMHSPPEERPFPLSAAIKRDNGRSSTMNTFRSRTNYTMSI